MRGRFIWLMACLLGSAATADVVVVVDERPVLHYTSSHALLVGVSEYAHWPDLPSIPGELDAVGAVLVEHGFDVEKVLDPDEDGLRRAIEDFIDAHGYTERKRLLLYFAGHGYSREVNRRQRGYLVPADAPLPAPGEPRAFLRKAVPMQQVHTWARSVEARHALFLFDSCFSGTVFDTRSVPRQPTYVSAMTARPLRQFLTAGSAGETVPGRSFFAPALVRGLRGQADLLPDGYITGTELYLYLRSQASEEGLTPLEGKLLGYHEGDFVFVSPLGPPPVEDFALDDLMEVAEREALWSEYQRKMEHAFDQAVRIDDTATSAATKHEAWRRFATTFERNNPLSTRDEQMQLQAAARLAELEAELSSGDEASPPKSPRPGDLWTEPAIGMRFRYVPPGTFLMGSPPDEEDRDDRETQHEVTLTRGYWLGEAEVTQAQWHEVMGTKPSRFDVCGNDCPVESVNWYEAIAFANSLSQRVGFSPCYSVSGDNGKKAGEGLEYTSVERLDGCSGYRLPSEAEWEHAARAGTIGATYGERDDIAWYEANSGNTIHAVGSKAANAWQLRDMLGNVLEWCEDRRDWGDDYSPGAKTDPLSLAGSIRVVRGGSWFSDARNVRAACRDGGLPGYRSGRVGFRLARGQGP